ncbi:MAG TPA: Lrp/AsnC ligand binding domain-containing protein [Armatimonadota bacterium]|jgi:DNA-binding Lrp family transcriptional regulator
MVTAIVLITVEQGLIPAVAEALIALPGIAETYSVAGSYDLVAIARVRQHEELADLVAQHLQKIPGITSTNTLIAFRAYSQRDLAAMWEIGFEEPTA